MIVQNATTIHGGAMMRGAKARRPERMDGRWKGGGQRSLCGHSTGQRGRDKTRGRHGRRSVYRGHLSFELCIIELS